MSKHGGRERTRSTSRALFSPFSPVKRGMNDGGLDAEQHGIVGASHDGRPGASDVRRPDSSPLARKRSMSVCAHLDELGEKAWTVPRLVLRFVPHDLLWASGQEGS